MTWTPLTTAERAAFEAELRACIGTPWRHMGRPGCGYGHQTGLDCVGLLVRAALSVGRDPSDLELYGRAPDGTLESILTERLGEPCAPSPGCIVLLRLPREPSHVGYITEAGTLLHAYNGGNRCVVEHPMGMWQKRIVRGWRV